ncbi:unnamed protein product [Toxocara canis]|uniref:Uncharacterized protein n=1 Tax=Toxocara canis TaxID=6265 RepID=A0A183U2D1_TOXCA|nr:unnamed protein product [Toxocara canis]
MLETEPFEPGRCLAVLPGTNCADESASLSTSITIKESPSPLIPLRTERNQFITLWLKESNNLADKDH